MIARDDFSTICPFEPYPRWAEHRRRLESLNNKAWRGPPSGSPRL